MSWVNVEITQKNTNVETGNKTPLANMKGWDLEMKFPDFPASGS